MFIVPLGLLKPRFSASHPIHFKLILMTDMCLVEFRVERVEVSFVMLKFGLVRYSCVCALLSNVSIDAGVSCRNF